MEGKTLTEYEWRRKKTHVRYQPKWVGPQCIYPRGRWRKRVYSKRFNGRMLLAAWGVSLAVLLLSGGSEADDERSGAGAQKTEAIQTKDAYRLTLPSDWQMEKCVIPARELLSGKLMVVDAEHPLPQNMTAPNTFSIAAYQGSSLAAVSQQIKTGKETLESLEKLFDQLEKENVEGLCISAGITTKVEQQSLRVSMCRELMKQNAPSVSCETAFQNTEDPGTGSLLLPYTIVICLKDPQSGASADQPLNDTPQGRRLLDLAWRYGFVPEGEEHPGRFRYVGKVHATAMTYLNIGLRAYLEQMHAAGTLVINEGGRPAYAVVCAPYEGGDAVFELPECESYEGSIDNLGSALVGCVL